MPYLGNRPLDPGTRAHGSSRRIEVVQTRAQSLEVGDVVLYRKARWVVTGKHRSRDLNGPGAGWAITLTHPNGNTTTRPCPAGHVWPVIPTPPEGPPAP